MTKLLSYTWGKVLVGVIFVVYLFAVHTFTRVTLMSDYERYIYYHDGKAPDYFVRVISNTCNEDRTEQTFVFLGHDGNIYTDHFDGCVIKEDS